jgi:hypothetical protein
MVLEILEVRGHVFKSLLVATAADTKTAQHRLEFDALYMIDFGKIVLNQVGTFFKLDSIKL